ncbi:YD repeat-containing protein [Peribacillus huizhouensis]|uniref:YD repeat-containing protein n=1 Tax=Peribacillus huizhouensis TaxID=1501239 RepID=A0ABR6CR50_9BACI|nr:YD repeat-containing protein [Peribacillus huizhouensis]
MRDQNGSMVVTYSYDAFGRPLTATGAAKTASEFRGS